MACTCALDTVASNRLNLFAPGVKSAAPVVTGKSIAQLCCQLHFAKLGRHAFTKTRSLGQPMS